MIKLIKKIKQKDFFNINKKTILRRGNLSLLEKISDNEMKNFLMSNWGAILSIKKKKRLKCSDEELISISVKAYLEADQTFSHNRSSNGKGKYNFVNHFLQYLKNEIQLTIKSQNFISFEECFSNVAVIPTLPINSVILHVTGAYSEYVNEYLKQYANDILDMVDSNDKKNALKIVKKIMKLSEEKITIEEISKKMKLPINKVEIIIKRIEELKNREYLC